MGVESLNFLTLCLQDTPYNTLGDLWRTAICLGQSEF